MKRLGTFQLSLSWVRLTSHANIRQVLFYNFLHLILFSSISNFLLIHLDDTFSDRELFLEVELFRISRFWKMVFFSFQTIVAIFLFCGSKTRLGLHLIYIIRAVIVRQRQWTYLQEVVGLNPAGCWASLSIDPIRKVPRGSAAFFLFILSLILCYLA